MRKNILILVLILFLPLFIISQVSALRINIAHGTSNIKLQWDPPSSLATVRGYRIFHRIQGGKYNYKEPIVDVDASVNECNISELDGDIAYYFVARAYNDYYESANSNEIMIAPPETTSTTTLITTTTTISTATKLGKPTGLKIIKR